MLCRGRIPFATAHLTGNGEYPDARGRLSLYATPAGVVVSAELWGLPAGAVLRLCLEREGKSCAKTCFPLLYEREGEAWFCDLTEKLSPLGWGDQGVCLTLANGQGKGETVVAWGSLRSRRARSG